MSTYTESVGDFLPFTDTPSGVYVRVRQPGLKDRLPIGQVLAYQLIPSPLNQAVTDAIAVATGLGHAFGKFDDDGIKVKDQIAFNRESVKAVTDTLTFNDSVTAYFQSQYFINPAIVVPTDATTFRLVYGDTTVTLRKPDFGDTDNYEAFRIQRENRGGDLQIFQDPMWPTTEILDFKFSFLDPTRRGAARLPDPDPGRPDRPLRPLRPAPGRASSSRPGRGRPGQADDLHRGVQIPGSAPRLMRTLDSNAIALLTGGQEIEPVAIIAICLESRRQPDLVRRPDRLRRATASPCSTRGGSSRSATSTSPRAPTRRGSRGHVSVKLDDRDGALKSDLRQQRHPPDPGRRLPVVRGPGGRRQVPDLLGPDLDADRLGRGRSARSPSTSSPRSRTRRSAGRPRWATTARSPRS